MILLVLIFTSVQQWLD